MNIKYQTLALAASFMLINTVEAGLVDTAPISGFARSFLTGEVISDATITVLETGLTLKTDKNGHFGPFYYPIGDKLTLELSKFGYINTQSATVTVPQQGLI